MGETVGLRWTNDKMSLLAEFPLMPMDPGIAMTATIGVNQHTDRIEGSESSKIAVSITRH